MRSAGAHCIISGLIPTHHRRPEKNASATIGFFKTGSPIIVQVDGPLHDGHDAYTDPTAYANADSEPNSNSYTPTDADSYAYTYTHAAYSDS